MKYAFILAQKAEYPVTLRCSVLGVSRSGLHAWRKRPTSRRTRSNAQLAAEVTAVHNRSRKAYESPRVHAELKARGVRVGKKRVERLMRENGLEARRKRRFRKTTDSRHSHRVRTTTRRSRWTLCVARCCAGALRGACSSTRIAEAPTPALTIAPS